MILRPLPKSIIAIIVVLATSALAFGSARASFNPQINYQGKLTDKNNLAVADGNYNMRFRLCADANCSSVLWTETRDCTTHDSPCAGTENRVAVTNGLFSVLLGSVTDVSGVDFNQALYLEVTIGGTVASPGGSDWETLEPRKKLGAVPAAFEAKYLQGKTWAAPGAIGLTTPNTGAFTTLSSAYNGASTALTVNQSGEGWLADIKKSGISKFMIDGAGNVGIGTTTPSGLLHVAGGQCVTSDTKLRRRRKKSKSQNPNSKDEYEYEDVEIKDIQAGDEILTLDENTGRLAVSRVNALMDMGVKEIYKLTTASGKTIRTTANHPYLARKSKAARTYAFIDASNIIYGCRQSGWRMDFKKLYSYLKVRFNAVRIIYYAGEDVANAKQQAFYNLLRQWGYELVIKPVKTFTGESGKITKKANVDVDLTFEAMLYFGEYDRAVFFTGDGDFYRLIAHCKVNKERVWLFGNAERTARELKTLMGHRFSNLDNLRSGFEYFGKDKENGANNKKGQDPTIGSARCIMGSSYQAQDCVSRGDDGQATKNPSFSTGESPCGDSSLATAISSLSGNLPFVKSDDRGRWTKVADLCAGMEIAAADENSGQAVWERIAKIEKLPAERVYDIEVEGTHNFVGNGIVAHNTYLQGADQSNDSFALRVQDSENTDKFVVTNAGNVGIGTTSPGALIDIGTAGSLLGTMRLEGNNSGYVQIQPAATAGNWTMTLPANDGDSGQVLTTNGSGVTSWRSSSASSETDPVVKAINGMVKSNGTMISAAAAGTDYSAGTAGLATGILKSTTATGALSIAAGSDINTTFGSQTANYIYAAPNGAAGNPAFRALVDADIPNEVTLTNITQITNRDHGSLTGLTDDDHSIYALLAGRTGGQKIIGGTGVADVLSLQGTAGNGTLASPAIQALVGNNGATTALTILNNGNIGIGTTDPQYKLDVNSASSRVAANDFNGITFEKQASPNQGALLFSSNRSGYTFYIGNKRSSDNNVLPIISMYDSGNVGIGTTTPGAKLDIAAGNLDLDNTINANQSGMITKNGAPFIHDFNYGDNGTTITDGYNTFVGSGAGNLTMGSTATETYHSSFNTGVGANALFSNTTGYGNSAFGSNALFSNTTGSNNFAMGNNAGRYYGSGTNTNQNSNNSLFIGYDTRANAAGGTNEIVIGASAIGAGSNSAVLGNDSITKTLLKGNVGIGTTSPRDALHITGNMQVNYGSKIGATTGSGAVGSDTYSGYFIPFDSNGNMWLVNRWDGVPNGNIFFQTQTTTRMTINIGGNVGIGTTSPGSLLHLNGTPGALSGGLAFGDGDTGMYEYSDDNFRLKTAGSDRITIDDTGNVGIGTTSPATGYMLDVNGYINTLAATNVDTDDYHNFNGSQSAKVNLDGSANTGIDETINNLYECTKFTAATNFTASSVGVRLRLSAAQSSSYDNRFDIELYSNSSDKPGTRIANSIVQLAYGGMTTSYVEYRSGFSPQPALTAGTSYWICINRWQTPATGSLYWDRASSGTGLYSYSPTGTLFVNENGKAAWFKVYGQTGSVVRGFNDTNVGIFGHSHSESGVYGESNTNSGVYGFGVFGAGVTGYSSNSHGGYFQSDKGTASLFAYSNSYAWPALFQLQSDGIVLALVDSDASCVAKPETGSLTWTCSSDVRLKTDIIDTASVLGDIMSLRIRDYTVIASGERRTGVIAQELIQTHPDMVHLDPKDPFGYYAVDDYNPWKTIKSVQELALALNDAGLINATSTYASTTTEFAESHSRFVDIVKSVLEKLGLAIKDGAASLKEVVVSKFTAKTARIEQLEMVDKVTGKVYCTWIENGVWEKTEGLCDEALADDTNDTNDFPSSFESDADGSSSSGTGTTLNTAADTAATNTAAIVDIATATNMAADSGTDTAAAESTIGDSTTAGDPTTAAAAAIIDRADLMNGSDSATDADTANDASTISSDTSLNAAEGPAGGE